MAIYTSRNPLVVFKNGTAYRLDSLATNIETKSGIAGMVGLRGSSPQVTGRNGSLYTPGKAREEGRVVISGWATFDNDDGIPQSQRYAQWRANMDRIMWLFDTQYGQIQLREYISDLSNIQTLAGEYRAATVEVTAAIDPEMLGPAFGRFTIECRINDTFWESSTLYTYTSSTGAANTVKVHTISELAGSTAPIMDATFTVTGPLTNARLTDVRSGHYVQYNGALASGALWVVDAAAWTSKVGGTSVTANTVPVGRMSPYLMGISAWGTDAPQVQVSGTGAGTASRFQVVARRKWLG